MSQLGTDSSPQLSPKTFARIADFVTDELGIKMPESKLSMIENRLLRRCRALGFDSLEAYTEFFFKEPAESEERVHFFDAVTTNKTDFFREEEHYSYLMRAVVPTLAVRGVITGWSAGCSSGEEPYTLAMLLSEHCKNTRDTDFALLATDVSSTVLARARLGIYNRAQINPVPLELRKRYLLSSRDRSQDHIRIVPELRQKISFHRLNFMDEDYRVGPIVHFIFFRNVMIYFDRPTQESVIRKLCCNLAPGGYLFVGHSESLAGMSLPLTQIGTSVFRKSE